MSLYTIAIGEELDFIIDWDDDFLNTGSPEETISTSSWEIEPDAGSPSELAFGATANSNTNSTATVWLNATTNALPGKVYRVHNTVTTSEGRTGKRTLVLRVVQGKI